MALTVAPHSQGDPRQHGDPDPVRLPKDTAHRLWDLDPGPRTPGIHIPSLNNIRFHQHQPFKEAGGLGRILLGPRSCGQWVTWRVRLPPRGPL